MCSIFGVLDIKTEQLVELRERALESSRLMRHRGPDWSGIYISDSAILIHERLAIVDVNTGAQPLYNNSRSHILAVNGEIYNHQFIRDQITPDYPFQTASDCEVILALYEKFGFNFIDQLQGMFAFLLYDEEKSAYLIARDHLGIVPLYTGHDRYGNFYVSSEMKGLIPICCSIKEFPPGSFLWSPDGKITNYYKRDWFSYENVKNNYTDLNQLRVVLEEVVASHLMSDVPYGVLLSGGLDSSIISAIAKRYAMYHTQNKSLCVNWGGQLHSFAVGLKGSPDLIASLEVADYLGTVHHEIYFTIKDGLDAIRQIIYHVETYDITTIRASIPMYLMARKIKAMGIKMVLSGEGSDEIFGGYLYFHKVPNAKELHKETVRKLLALHMYDCARANKAMAAWGVEARIPFLDKRFLDVAMRINPQDKLCQPGKMEKYILRKCFESYLPERIVWRQKEQFSDGVGYSWIDSLKHFSDLHVSDKMLEEAYFRFPYNPPTSKEGYLYRDIFEQFFPLSDAAKCVPSGPSVACSSAEAIEWDVSFKKMNDPSGRAVEIHQDAYREK